VLCIGLNITLRIPKNKDAATDALIEKLKSLANIKKETDDYIEVIQEFDVITDIKIVECKRVLHHAHQYVSKLKQQQQLMPLIDAYLIDLNLKEEFSKQDVIALIKGKDVMCNITYRSESPDLREKMQQVFPRKSSPKSQDSSDSLDSCESDETPARVTTPCHNNPTVTTYHKSPELDAPERGDIDWSAFTADPSMQTFSEIVSAESKKLERRARSEKDILTSGIGIDNGNEYICSLNLVPIKDVVEPAGPASGAQKLSQKTISALAKAKDNALKHADMRIKLCVILLEEQRALLKELLAFSGFKVRKTSDSRFQWRPRSTSTPETPVDHTQWRMKPAAEPANSIELFRYPVTVEEVWIKIFVPKATKKEKAPAEKEDTPARLATPPVLTGEARRAEGPLQKPIAEKSPAMQQDDQAKEDPS
jgi:hypothetical protein